MPRRADQPLIPVNGTNGHPTATPTTREAAYAHNVFDQWASNSHEKWHRNITSGHPTATPTAGVSGVYAMSFNQWASSSHTNRTCLRCCTQGARFVQRSRVEVSRAACCVTSTEERAYQMTKDRMCIGVCGSCGCGMTCQDVRAMPTFQNAKNGNVRRTQNVDAAAAVA